MTPPPGMIIESIDGEAIAPDRDLAQYLNRKAGKKCAAGGSATAPPNEVATKPVAPAEENRLLYNRWVRRNQEEVDRLSNGQLGYIHMPGMNDGAYRTTFEEVMGKYASRDGIVVDTRFNGGGDLVADLAMFLSGKKFFDYTTDTRSNGYEPNFRWTKPSGSLANEANYSDGHCYAFAYKNLKLGTLVGMPVPGTCTFRRVGDPAGRAALGSARSRREGCDDGEVPRELTNRARRAGDERVFGGRHRARPAARGGGCGLAPRCASVDR